MNKEIKQQWVKALRSGKYEQTKGTLRDEVGFCCLGVLCDLHAKAGLGKWDIKNWYLSQANVLPDEVIEWADLDDMDPLIRFEDDRTDEQGYRRLSGLNDQEQCTFDQIADVIEERL